jgi:hypothetical protein
VGESPVKEIAKEIPKAFLLEEVPLMYGYLTKPFVEVSCRGYQGTQLFFIKNELKSQLIPKSRECEVSSYYSTSVI